MIAPIFKQDIIVNKNIHEIIDFGSSSYWLKIAQPKSFRSIYLAQRSRGLAMLSFGRPNKTAKCTEARSLRSALHI